jgi:hypothetical protein
MKHQILLVSCMAVLTISKQPVRSKLEPYGKRRHVPSSNFIGTTDTKDFVIRTKNAERVRVKANGNIGINLSGSPIALLDLRNSKEINSIYATNSSTNSNQFGFRTVVNGIQCECFQNCRRIFRNRRRK